MTAPSSLYMSQKNLAIAIIVFVLAAGALILWWWQGPRLEGYEMSEISVTLQVSETLKDLAHQAEEVEGVGTVLFMRAMEVPDQRGAMGCILGAIYKIEKSSIGDSGWTPERLKQLTVDDPEAPQQAKELSNSYLLFIPADDVCTRDPAYTDAENEKRGALLLSVKTAEDI